MEEYRWYTVFGGMVQSVNRALDVLFLLAGSDGTTTASGIAKELDLPRPTVYRILDTLVERHLVVKSGLAFDVVDEQMQRLLRR